jgi:hypothetical protein
VFNKKFIGVVMKNHSELISGLILLLITILFSACGGTSTTTITTIYQQEGNASGPINQAPIHVTEEAQTPWFTVSPRFSYKSAQQVSASMEGHTPVNSEGIFQVDTIFHNNGTISFQETPGANTYEYVGRNLIWDVATFTGGIDFDARFTKSFAAFAGFNYSSGNSKNVWGGNLGLAFLIAKSNLGLRLDAGVKIQSIAYDAYTVEVIKTSSSSGTYEYVVFYHDLGQATQWDPFINFTFNTTPKNWFVNFFLNAGFSQQTLIGFTPETKDEEHYHDYGIFGYDYHHEIVEDKRGKSTASYISLTPGLFFRIGKSGRILLGVRFYFDNGLDDATESIYILPMLQADFSFSQLGSF